MVEIECFVYNDVTNGCVEQSITIGESTKEEVVGEDYVPKVIVSDENRSLSELVDPNVDTTISSIVMVSRLRRSAASSVIYDLLDPESRNAVTAVLFEGSDGLKRLTCAHIGAA
ncbi:hypothetical protein V3C99_018034 [Haemonchus contortus]|uniref:Pentatricopeptide repeat-containing protein n=1 Tax=Haemonchus contortus TaxID=6289 RepID=A0A7I5EEK5_HAECO